MAAAEQRLLSLPVLEAFIARRECGDDLAADGIMIEAVAAELFEHQSADGSWGGNIAITAETLLLLAELQVEALWQLPIERATQWLRGQRGVHGRFTDDCSIQRHELGLCGHFSGGFFSPGAAEYDLGGWRLSTGLALTTDAEVRLGLSALALRAVRRWSASTTDDQLHIEALIRIAQQAFRPAALALGLPSLTLVLAALAEAPRTPQAMAATHGALTRLAGMQRADGSWPGAEPFHVADVYLLALRNGYGSPLFDAAVVRTAQTLALTQQADGSWGQDGGPYRLLSGWRALRHAAALEGLSAGRIGA